MIDACVALLKENHQALVDAMEADFGRRSRGMSLMYDLMGSVTSLNHARDHTERWMRPQKRKTPFPFNLSGARVRVEYQPLGVIGILGTWNFPLFTLFAPLSQVLAAGNRCILKPSDLVPRTTEHLCGLMTRYADSDTLAVVGGDRSVAEQFSRLPFDHLVLTGGTQVGKAVMAAAAANLVEDRFYRRIGPAGPADDGVVLIENVAQVVAFRAREIPVVEFRHDQHEIVFLRQFVPLVPVIDRIPVDPVHHEHDRPVCRKMQGLGLTNQCPVKDLPAFELVSLPHIDNHLIWGDCR